MKEIKFFAGFPLALLILLSLPPVLDAIPSSEQPREKKVEGCEWAAGYHVSGMNDGVEVSAVADDGSGPTLFVGGHFLGADDQLVNHIAKWDGANWTAIGSGTDGVVRAIKGFDDGTGLAVYVGGLFTTAGGISTGSIAKWDGKSWSPLSSGIDGWVFDLEVFDDGTGPALYASGEFELAGGVEALNIARWDGSAWSAVEAGLPKRSYTLQVFDDGSGPALYAGQTFDIDFLSSRILKWDGTSWTALGEGPSTFVEDLAVFDDGSGPALYAGGGFTSADDNEAKRVAKWNGTEWVGVGIGLGREVRSLEVYDDGGGAQLYATGDFDRLGDGSAIGYIARWDGTEWTSVGPGLSWRGSSLTVHDDGSGPSLFIGGSFTNTGDEPANRFARWDGSTLSAVTGTDIDGAGTTSEIYAATTFDDGDGEALFLGFNKTVLGEEVYGHIAAWDGQSLTPLGDGVDGGVYALTTFDDGSGVALYAAGEFETAGGLPATRIAKWDGSTWSALGLGLDDKVWALTTFDDGTGPALYAAGELRMAGGSSASRIAKWDGTTWSALTQELNNTIRELVVFDDGTGPALYAGGDAQNIGLPSRGYVRKWDGSEWTDLDLGLGDRVYALAVFDDGTGPALYAGGSFTTLGDGSEALYIARWNGSAWSAAGEGVAADINSLVVYDDGTSPGLYAGSFQVDPVGASFAPISKWDGTSWSTLGQIADRPPSTVARSLTAFDDGTGPSLYIGGRFDSVGDQPSANFAEYTCFSPPVLSLPELVHGAEGSTVEVPIALDTGRQRLGTARFSIDYDSTCLDPDVDGDGQLDSATLLAGADFDLVATLDTADTDGEIEIEITDVSAPVAELPDGPILILGFQAVCDVASGSTMDVDLAFAGDPAPGYASTLGEPVSGRATDGLVRLWPGPRGDCDGNGAVESPDLLAIATEIFDGDGDLWSDAPSSTFPGAPVGCDADAGTRIRAADVACANRLLDGESCGAESSLKGVSAGPELEVRARWNAGLTWIGARFFEDGIASGGALSEPVSSFVLSLDIDSVGIDISAIDADDDGIPDHLRFPQGEHGLSVVRWNAADMDGELDLLIARLEGLPFTAGEVIEIGIPGMVPIEQRMELSLDPAPSFGTVLGSELVLEVRISVNLFADGFESGDTSAWSESMP